MPEKVLVTGGTGFIGSNLVSSLLRQNYNVRVLARNRQVTEKIEGVEIFEGDLTDFQSLSGIEDQVDIVVHCAGIMGKWGVSEESLYRVNVQGTLNLLKKFSSTSISVFIHLSAGGVTGPVRGNVADETYVCMPVTPYEKSKFLGEKKVLELSEEMNIPVVVLRPTFTYGPGDPHKTALFRAVKKGKFAFIGNGKSLNTPVYIDDLINGIILAIEKGRAGETYIIGGRSPVTKLELIYTISDELGVRRPRVMIPRWFAWPVASCFEILGRIFQSEPVITRSRVMMMGDNFGYSIGKAEKELMYEPKTDLKEGIAKTVQSYIGMSLL